MMNKNIFNTFPSKYIDIALLKNYIKHKKKYASEVILYLYNLKILQISPLYLHTYNIGSKI